MLHLIVGPLTFPLLVEIGPDLGVGGVHDGDQDVEHEDGHDDLVKSPDNPPHGMGESAGDVVICSVGSLYVSTVWVVSKDNPPEHRG